MEDAVVPNMGDLGLHLNQPMLGGPRLMKKSTEDAGVKMARNRFKNVLKHMVQESFMQEEESDSDEDNRGGLMSMPPSKRHKSNNGEPMKAQPTFVMKLFDRGVDLAQFNDSTPLYPICRAWIQNKPHAVRPQRNDSDEDSEPSEMEWKEETEDVYRLPPPEPLPYDEFGVQMTFRVPPQLQRTDEEFDIDYDDESAPSPALLFQNHLDRWNLIRQRWKEASAYNETRYMESFGILRTIYDRNRPEDTTRVGASGNNAANVLDSSKVDDEETELFLG